MTTLHLQRLNASFDAKCNDGTAPAFYLHPGSDDVLLLWLQGGGDCGTQETCDERWSNSRYLMSTAELPAEIQLDGIFSDSETQNPLFARSTRVFVPYCSSDSWLGRRVERVHGYYFQGAHILRAVLRAVLPRLRSAPRLAVLGGCSAGGRGAFYNLDSWCSMLPSTSSCRGLLDAAWWVPDAGPLENGAANGIELWKADLWPCTGSDNDSETPSSLDESGHLCMFGATWAQHVKTPYLVHEEQFDHFMLSRRAVHRPVVSWSSNAWRSAEALRDAVRNSFQDALTGTSVAFSGTCTDHCFAESAAYWSVKVHGVTMAQLAQQWIESQDPVASVIETCDGPNCSSGCPWEPLLHEVLLLAAVAALLCCLGCACGRRVWRRSSARAAAVPARQWEVIGAADEDEVIKET